MDVLGELAAALVATVACGVAAVHTSSRRSRWVLLGASSFAWAAGETVWAYYDLVRHVSVPFPSLADVGFLGAVPLALAGILLFPSSPRTGRRSHPGDPRRVHHRRFDAFCQLGDGPRSFVNQHQDGVLKQTLSLAYPASDVVMVSLVVILLARAGRRGRASLGLVMAGIVAFAISDSAFAYMTELNNYANGTVLDTGWVAGYLLIGLGALRAVYAPSTEAAEPRVTTLSLVAPYVPVLAVLAVTAVELLLGQRLGSVDWMMVFTLALLVLGRNMLKLWERASLVRMGESDGERFDESITVTEPEADPVLLGR